MFRAKPAASLSPCGTVTPRLRSTKRSTSSPEGTRSRCGTTARTRRPGSVRTCGADALATSSAHACRTPLPLPCRSTKICPSGKRCATRCAHWTARAVLPMPAGPSTTRMTGLPSAAVTDPSNIASSCSRPTQRMPRGSWRGTVGAASTDGPAVSGPGSARRIRACSALVCWAGSTPSRSASRRRSASYASMASARRPRPCSPVMRLRTTSSLSGCWSASAYSSSRSSARPPSRSSPSWHSTSADSRSRSSSRRVRSAHSPVIPPRGLPRQMPSASRNSRTAVRVSVPVARALATVRRKRCRSTASASTSSTYPPCRRRSVVPGPPPVFSRTPRSREM